MVSWMPQKSQGRLLEQFILQFQTESCCSSSMLICELDFYQNKEAWSSICLAQKRRVINGWVLAVSIRTPNMCLPLVMPCCLFLLPAAVANIALFLHGKIIACHVLLSSLLWILIQEQSILDWGDGSASNVIDNNLEDLSSVPSIHTVDWFQQVGIWLSDLHTYTSVVYVYSCIHTSTSMYTCVHIYMYNKYICRKSINE